MLVAYLTGVETIELRDEPASSPGQGELRVRIGAATTCGTDVKVFRRGGHPRMLQVPAPFGHELAGSVDEVGPGVDAWRPGDRVVVANSAACFECPSCRSGRENLCEDLQYLNGAFAESILVPARFVERSTYALPDGLPFELAALSEPLACVLHGIDACGLLGADACGHLGADACGLLGADACSLVEATDIALYGAGPIGLLFVAALSQAGHRVVVADPNLPRLETARLLGAAATVEIARGGGQAARLRDESADGAGFHVVVEATGVPAVWADALQTVRPGGLVNLFGGCAPGTTVPLDTQRLHYSEITVKGVYHHRPATFARALDLLASGRIDAGRLLEAERPLASLEEALRLMMQKEALKVVIRP